VCAEFGSGDLLLSGTQRDEAIRQWERTVRRGGKVIGLRHHERGKGERKMVGGGRKQNGLGAEWWWWWGGGSQKSSQNPKNKEL
jgi:hypothetical protein